MVELKNKVALVTGASSGIGAAAARALAQAGTKLILCARRLPRLESFAEALQQEFNATVFILELDVRDSDAVIQSLYQLPSAFQKIDILINSAGLAAGLDLVKDAELSDWEAMIDTNIKGLLYLTRAILPKMLAENQGHIVNISSLAGHRSYPKGVVYCATKAAVKSLSRGLKQECLGSNVRVTDIAPGSVATEFSAVRFKGDLTRAQKVYADLIPLSAADIADSIMFALTRPLHVNIVEMVINAKDQPIQLV